jgi:hypothetical protein
MSGSGNNTSLALKSCPLLQKCAECLNYVCLVYIHVVLKSGTQLKFLFETFSPLKILKLHNTIFRTIFIKI